jgi:hypothetical protein
MRQLFQEFGVEVLDFVPLVPRWSDSSVWAMILERLLDIRNGNFQRLWSLVEVFLEFGAEIPSFRRTTDELLLIEFKTAALDVDPYYLGFGYNMPQALEYCNGSASLQDFINHQQPPNTAAITRILEERTKREVELESSKGSISVQSIELTKEQHEQ